MLSYKYIKRLFHHVYTFSTFKLTEENANLMVRIAPKLLTRIFDLQSKFLPKFSQAIREITRNINFVEKEMQTEDIMLAEELEYRRYIIYLAAKDGKGELNEFVIRKLTMVRSPHLSPWCLFRSNCGGLQKKKVEETAFIVDTENGAFATSSQVAGFSSFNEFLLRTVPLSHFSPV